jgi:hypothetical protein
MLPSSHTKRPSPTFRTPSALLTTSRCLLSDSRIAVFLVPRVQRHFQPFTGQLAALETLVAVVGARRPGKGQVARVADHQLGHHHPALAAAVGVLQLGVDTALEAAVARAVGRTVKAPEQEFDDALITLPQGSLGDARGMAIGRARFSQGGGWGRPATHLHRRRQRHPLRGRRRRRSNLSRVATSAPVSMALRPAGGGGASIGVLSSSDGALSPPRGCDRWSSPSGRWRRGGSTTKRLVTAASMPGPTAAALAFHRPVASLHQRGRVGRPAVGPRLESVRPARQPRFLRLTATARGRSLHQRGGKGLGSRSSLSSPSITWPPASRSFIKRLTIGREQPSWSAISRCDW